MKNRMNKKIIPALAGLFFLLAAASPPAYASSADYGYITYVYATANGAILFNTSGTRSSPLPACQGASVPQRYAIDASTTAGQAVASTLITAYTLHKRILVYGSGTCTIWGDTETITFILLED